MWTGSNPALSLGELIHHLRTSRARFIICTSERLAITRKAAAECEIPEKNIYVFSAASNSDDAKSWRSLLNYGSKDWAPFDDERKSKETVAALYATSGTSGLPKFAMITHRNMIAASLLLHGVEARTYQVRQMLNFPMFHLASLSFVQLTPLRHCWQTYVMPRFDPLLFAESVHRFRCTDTATAPAMMLMLLQAKIPDIRAKLTSLQHGACGSAPVSKELYEKWRTVIPPGCVWTGAYGMTETTGIVTINRFPVSDFSGSIGVLLANTEAK